MSAKVPRIHYATTEGHRTANIVQGQLGGMLLEGPAPPWGEALGFGVEAPDLQRGVLTGLGRPFRVPGVEGRFGMKLLRLASCDGVPALKEFLRDPLGTEWDQLGADQIVRIGNNWFAICSPTDPEAALQRNPKILSDAIKAYFEPRPGETTVNVYPRESCVYLNNGVPFAGRTVRLNENTLVVATNRPLPGLGNHVLVQIPIQDEGKRTHVVVRTTVSRRSDQKDDSTYKGRFELKVHDVEELGRPGSFFAWLDTLRH